MLISRKRLLCTTITTGDIGGAVLLVYPWRRQAMVFFTSSGTFLGLFEGETEGHLFVCGFPVKRQARQSDAELYDWGSLALCGPYRF